MYENIYLVMLGAFGLVFGSFANVVIHRFPLGESVVRPRSRCPECKTEIRWYDNLPVLSWVVLRARCRDCGTRISARYPAVEALSGLLWVLAGVLYGFTPQAVIAIAFFYVLLVLAFIDLDTYRLPNPIVAVLFSAGVVGAALGQVLAVDLAPLVGVAESGWLSEPLAAAGIGIVLGVAPSLGLAAIYGALRGREGLGMGDVKLLGAMGPFLGPYVLLAFFGGSVLGTLVSVPLMARARRDGDDPVGAVKIPFGPFIAAAGALTVLVGEPIVEWYVGLIGL